MILTDKCKEDFEKWFRLEYRKGVNEYLIYSLSAFIHFPPEMKYSVYIDFFDSVGITISVLARIREGFMYSIDYKVPHQYSKETETRQEAREQAITKSNEIYNESK